MDDLGFVIVFVAIVTNLVCGFACSIFAANRNYYPGIGFLIGFFLGLLGILVVFCLPPRDKPDEAKK